METAVIHILAETVGNPELAKTFTAATDIFNEAGLDSIQMIEFILKLEEHLELQINFDEFHYSHLATIGSLVKFLEMQTSAVQAVQTV